MTKLYTDKLDGTIDAGFWARKSSEWRAEQQKIREAIRQHEQANTSYFEQGSQIIELARRAYSLWLGQDPFEKANLLRILLWNCIFDGVVYTPLIESPSAD